MPHTDQEYELTTIPAVGSTRAGLLESAGFDTVESVAAATVSELSAIVGISNRMAPCIHEGAKELCGYRNTLQNEIAVKLGVQRDEVADAFAEIAHLSGTIKQKRGALEEFFSRDAENSVLHLEGYALSYPYLLYREGYQSIEDLASASLDDLAAVNYFDHERADSFRRVARDMLSWDVADEGTASPIDTSRVGDRVSAGDAHELLQEALREKRGSARISGRRSTGW
jgi:hypothetical protein